MEDQQSQELCEKSTTLELNPLELHHLLLYIIYNTIGNYIQYINSKSIIINNNTRNDGNSTAILAEEFFKSQRTKLRKKRGRPSQSSKQPKEVSQEKIDWFVKFWTKYPRQQSRAAALKIWLRIPKLELIFPAIMEALDWQIGEWDDGKYAPAPAKYLLEKRWEDKPHEGSAKKSKGHGAFGDLGYEFPDN